MLTQRSSKLTKISLTDSSFVHIADLWVRCSECLQSFFHGVLVNSSNSSLLNS